MQSERCCFAAAKGAQIKRDMDNTVALASALLEKDNALCEDWANGEARRWFMCPRYPTSWLILTSRSPPFRLRHALERLVSPQQHIRTLFFVCSFSTPPTGFRVRAVNYSSPETYPVSDFISQLGRRMDINNRKCL